MLSRMLGNILNPSVLQPRTLQHPQPQGLQSLSRHPRDSRLHQSQSHKRSPTGPRFRDPCQTSPGSRTNLNAETSITPAPGSAIPLSPVSWLAPRLASGSAPPSAQRPAPPRPRNTLPLFQQPRSLRRPPPTSHEADKSGHFCFLA